MSEFKIDLNDKASLERRCIEGCYQYFVIGAIDSNGYRMFLSRDDYSDDWNGREPSSPGVYMFQDADAAYTKIISSGLFRRVSWMCRGGSDRNGNATYYADLSPLLRVLLGAPELSRKEIPHLWDARIFVFDVYNRKIVKMCGIDGKAVSSFLDQLDEDRRIANANGVTEYPNTEIPFGPGTCFYPIEISNHQQDSYLFMHTHSQDLINY